MLLAFVTVYLYGFCFVLLLKGVSTFIWKGGRFAGQEGERKNFSSSGSLPKWLDWSKMLLPDLHVSAGVQGLKLPAATLPSSTVAGSRIERGAARTPAGTPSGCHTMAPAAAKSHSNRSEMTSHCAIDLHFPVIIFPYTCWSLVFLLLKTFYSGLWLVS